MNSLNAYLEKLNCPEERERIYAAEDLGYLNVPECVPVLLERLQEERSPAVRHAIFQALTRMDTDASIEASIGLLGSEDPQVRNEAVVVLRRKGARSIPFLKTVMQDGDNDSRKLVLDVLSGIHAGGAMGIYEAALSDKDPNVVITAVENLGKVRALEFRSRIEALLEANSHPMLTAACLEALVRIGQESSLAVIRLLFPELGKAPDFLLAPCLKAIAALGMAKEFAEVASLLPVRGPHLRSAILSALLAIYPRCPSLDPGADLLPALQRVVENGDPPLCRYLAVQVMGFWAIRDDVYAFLVSCLSSMERLVRLGAAESLRLTVRPGLKPILAACARTEADEEVLQVMSR